MQIGVNTNRPIIFKNSQPLKPKTVEGQPKPGSKDLPEGKVVDKKDTKVENSKKGLNLLA